MKYEIQISGKAFSFLEKLQPKVRRQLGRKIGQLTDNPRPAGSRKISDKEEVYRIKSGVYRVIYEIFDDRLVIYLLLAGHRKDVYRLYSRLYRK